MKAVAASNSSAAMPSTWSCEVTGRSPMKGRRNCAMERRAGAAFAVREEPLAPGPRVVGPAACRLVIVVEAALEGRAAAFGFEPHLKKSPNDDLVFIACA